jgi:hypothetical protein
VRRRGPRPLDLAQFVATLRARGVRLRPEGTTLWIHGARQLTRWEKMLVRQHKAGILAMLRRPAPPRPGPGPWLNAPWLWPVALPGLGPHTVGPYAQCGDCAATGGEEREEAVVLSLGPGPVGVTWTARIIAGTFGHYGPQPLCLDHARARARRARLATPVYVDPMSRAAWAAMITADLVTRACRVVGGVITDVHPMASPER